MRTSSIILATLSLVALVSAQVEDASTRWCKAFGVSCQTAANTVCGMNRQSNWNCKVNFNGTVCQSFEVKCNCIPTGGALTAASQVALFNTFQATNGACQNVPMRLVPSASVTAPPPIVGSQPTMATTTPIPSPGSVSAGTINSNSALAAAVVMGAVVLAL
ncbi:hypothetical protein BGZ74_000061 [Mortierella antarctica]|nr:hypothetical protein BGZ74_000061 [Mortierella antarctica]KAG0363193.1 hypothetical protein BG005_002342 [Podila minutissima]